MDKALLEKSLADLKKPRQQLLEEYTAAAITTFPDEVGLKHPTLDVGVHVRDDGSLELFAGSARILLDSETGTIVMIGNHLVSSTMDSNTNLSDDASFAINNIPLNFSWLRYGFLQNLLGVVNGKSLETTGPNGETPSLSPVTFKQWQGGTETFLTGTPAADQTIVPFSSVFDSKPLFLPPSDTEYLDSLNNLLEGVM